uniref:Uncharacterized protein n=1 Tax=Aegilops tauschii TaxID=37682 RepID=M8BU16_AEGTA
MSTNKGGGGGKKEVKKETKLGMAYKKDDNFGEWYSEVRIVRRDNGTKVDIPSTDLVEQEVEKDVKARTKG